MLSNKNKIFQFFPRVSIPGLWSLAQLYNEIIQLERSLHIIIFKNGSNRPKKSVKKKEGKAATEFSKGLFFLFFVLSFS